jgi:uncharacterized protein YkwD
MHRRHSAPLPAPLQAATLLAALLAVASPPMARAQWTDTEVDEATAAALYGTQAEAITLPSARRLLLDLVNAERQRSGLSALTPLPLADTLAQEHAGEMAERHYPGHTSLAGLKCEARFDALGGTDQVEENYAFYEINRRVFLTGKLVRRMHAHWMDSAPHRANVLAPPHTAAGFGLSIVQEGGRSFVAGVEEFVTDVGECRRLPATLQPGRMLTVAGRLDPSRATLGFVALGREELPFPRSPQYQREHVGEYSAPPITIAYLPGGFTKLVGPGVRQVRFGVACDKRSGAYRLTIPPAAFTAPGAYYVTVWTIPPGAVNATPPGAADADASVFCASTQVVLRRAP